MKFQKPFSPELTRLIGEKAKRPELLEGFEIADDVLEKHRGVVAHHHREKSAAEREAIAVYHALFDPTAPHSILARKKQEHDRGEAIAKAIAEEGEKTRDDARQSRQSLVDTLIVIEKARAPWDVAKVLILAAILLLLCAGKAHCQSQSTLVLQGQNSGSVLFTRTAGFLGLNCTGTLGCTFSNNVLSLNGGGGTGSVTTVFGRSGPAITAASGDYTCSQVTGCLGLTALSATNPIVYNNSTGAFSWTNSLGYISLASLSASNPITYNSSTGAFGWTNSLNYITLGSLSGSGPISYNSGTGAFSWTNSLNYITLGSLSASNPITYNSSTGAIGWSNTPGYITSSGNAATATALASAPTQCSGNNFATGIATSGNANCSQPAYSQISGTPTLYYQTFEANSTTSTQRPKFNLAAGSNVTITATDNGVDTTTYTVAASGGSGSTRTPTPFFSYWGNTSGAVTKGMAFPAGGCTGSGSPQNLWPAAGVISQPTVYTNTTNGALGFRINLAPDCAYGSAPAPGGVVLAPVAAGGAYTDSYVGDSYHLQQNGWYATASAKVGANNAATSSQVNYVSFSFVDDAGLYQTVMGGGDNGHAAPVNSNAPSYFALGGQYNNSTTAANVSVPMPFAGTVGTLTACAYSLPTGGNQSLGINKNGTVTNYLTETPSDAANSCYSASPALSFVAGDYLSMAVTALSGVTTGGATAQWSVALYPTSGTASIVAGVANQGVSTTQIYLAPGGYNGQSTASSGTAAMPISCTARNLYAVLTATQNTGVSTAVTIYKNGSATAVTGSIASATAAGVLALDTTHTASFSPGDTVAFSLQSTGGTSSTIGGLSFQCN